MDIVIIIGIAIALSMDALAVSITNGFLIKELKTRHAFKIAFFFGFFQAMMPIIGWAAGLSFRLYIQNYDHWVAFGLLSFIGGKMIYESIFRKKDKASSTCLYFPVLLLMSIATSIDALAVGLSFSFLKISIITPALIIGVITFFICIVGVYIGNKIGHFFENKLELAGGVILILIGLKILLEHLI